MQGLALDNSELREHTHGLLVHTAELLHQDFAPWLPRAVEAALASCAQVRQKLCLCLWVGVCEHFCMLCWALPLRPCRMI